MSERCETCRFWQLTGQAYSSQVPSHGTCRRRSPSVTSVSGGWPYSSSTDWCGEHEPKETDNGSD